VGWFSSLSESYNSAIYTFLAPFLAQRLFWQQTAWNAVFFSYCIFWIAVGLFYPAGAAYFGLIGDKKGRNRTCLYSTFGLALTTGVMGLIPMGEYAWIFFGLFICLQFFFSGGEYSGSVVFALEHAKEQKSGLLGSVSSLFSVFGLLLANGFAILSQLSQNEWAARTCFFVGAGGGLLSYLLKNHCRETPSFLSQRPLDTVDLFSLIRRRSSEIVGAVLVIGLFYVLFGFIFLFLPLAFDEQVGPQFDTFKALMVYGLCLVVAGWLSDRIGAARLIAFGSILVGASILPLCSLCHDLLTLQVLLTMLACLIIGPVHSWTLQQFAVQERCRGIFMSSAIAMLLFCGSTVPVCLLLFETFHSLAICGLYPCALSILVGIYLVVPARRVQLR